MLKLRADGNLFGTQEEKYIIYWDESRKKYWAIFRDNKIAALTCLYNFNDIWPTLELKRAEEEFPEFFETYKNHKFLWS